MDPAGAWSNRDDGTRVRFRVWGGAGPSGDGCSGTQGRGGATAVYHNVDKALEAGYVPVGGCEPGMGYHYVDFANFESTDPLVPAALLYAPSGNGKLRLAGVEWFAVDADQDLTTDDDKPSMFGKEFDGPMPGHAPGMPIHYDLHAYIWQGNPDGVLETWNRNIRCPAH
ncbi:hypothetical protein ACH9EU_03880 [Kocuria sp. M1R5S2]|uniref:hypothetical protein n=1 Tax=Kocuria rhizosphaerae TaxID=3376285 RepID=UPI0037BB08AE